MFPLHEPASELKQARSHYQIHIKVKDYFKWKSNSTREYYMRNIYFIPTFGSSNISSILFHVNKITKCVYLYFFMR